MPNRRRPKFFWSDEYLQELSLQLGGECKILCLSPVSFRLLADMTAMLLWPTRYEEGEVSEFGRIAYQELNVPCNFTDLVTVLAEIRDAIVNRPADDFVGLEVAINGVQSAINNQDLTVDLSALEPPLTGIQTAIENQVLTVDLSSLEMVLTGIQTAIENQVLTVDLSSLETALTGIQTAIENQEFTIDLTDFQAALTTAINGVKTAIENQETGCTVDFSELAAVLAGIQGAIENLSEDDMQIINNMCCGGCGCGNPKIDTLPPEDAPEDPLPPLPDIQPPASTPSFQQYLCNISHGIVAGYRESLMRIATLVEVGEANYGNINNVISATLGLLFTVPLLPWAVYYFLVTWIIERITDGAAERFGAAIDTCHDDLVCALYSGDGLEDKRARFRAVIDKMALSWADRYWMKLVEQSIPYEALYREDWEDVVFSPEFANSECCEIGVENAFPPNPAPLGYRWIYPSVDDTFESTHYDYDFCSPGGGTVTRKDDGTLYFQSDGPPSGCLGIEYGWPNIDLEGGILCGVELYILNGDWSSCYFADPALGINGLTWGVNDSVLPSLPFPIFLGSESAPAEASSFAENYTAYVIYGSGALPKIRAHNNNTDLAVWYQKVRFLVRV